MRILILAVGKSKTEFYEAAIAEYEKRLSRWARVEWRFVAVGGVDPESARLGAAIPPDAFVVLLDERGESFTTPRFASLIESLQNQSTKHLVFIIGGAHGVDDELRKRADRIWSLSDLVFPHEQVRVMLMEQLYRAYDLNNGGSYHHD